MRKDIKNSIEKFPIKSKKPRRKNLLFLAKKSKPDPFYIYGENGMLLCFHADFPLKELVTKFDLYETTSNNVK